MAPMHRVQMQFESRLHGNLISSAAAKSECICSSRFIKVHMASIVRSGASAAHAPQPAAKAHHQYDCVVHGVYQRTLSKKESIESRLRRQDLKLPLVKQCLDLDPATANPVIPQSAGVVPWLSLQPELRRQSLLRKLFRSRMSPPVPANRRRGRAGRPGMHWRRPGERPQRPGQPCPRWTPPPEISGAWAHGRHSQVHIIPWY